MKITTQTTKLNPLHPDFDTQLSSLAGSIVTGLGVLPTVSGDKTCYEIPANFLTLELADMLHSKGVEIKGFPLWIEIESIQDACPFIEKGTWEDWKLDNHTFYEADGRIFIGSNAHTNEDMDWADLQVVREDLHTADMLPVKEQI
jgi:hypothetical protein